MPKFRSILVYINTAILAVLIIVLLLFYVKAQKAAGAMATELRKLGGEYIEYTVSIKDTLPLLSDVAILNQTSVDLDMLLKQELPIHMEQRVTDSFKLPVRLHISEIMHVDTSLVLPDSLQFYAKGNIPIAQKFALLGKNGLKIKTFSNVPLEQMLTVKMQSPTAYRTDIPVRLDIQEQIPVALNLAIPIHQTIPLRIPIRTPATVSFPGKLRIAGYIPIQLDIPVRIPLSETPLKKRLDNAANYLESMF